MVAVLLPVGGPRPALPKPLGGKNGDLTMKMLAKMDINGNMSGNNGYTLWKFVCELV